jgi:8-oxo-dGTP pyrophosphatase MutT (NUDIX family)
MIKKIFFGNKPVFLCSKINADIEEVLQSKGTVYIDEITKSSVYNIVKQVSNPTFGAVVFFSTDGKDLERKFFKEFDIIKAGGGLVKNELGEILFIFRRGFWDLPKGKKDPGEKFKQCAIREVEEETGLTQIETGKKICTTYHTYIENNRKILKKTRWYDMTATKSQPLVPQFNEGIQQIEWVNANNIREKIEHSFPLISDVLEEGGILIDR